MFKLFTLTGIFCTYAWFVSTNTQDSLYEAGLSVYEYIVQKAEEHDIELHIHTPACFHEMVED